MATYSDESLAAPSSSVTSRSPWRGVFGALAIVLFGGLCLGGLTSPAQTVFPAWLRPLANSAGGWTMLAYLLVWLSRAKPLVGIVLGAVAFVALDNGYRVISGLRGFPYTEGFVSSWTIIGLVAGPIIGLAAALVRHRNGTWRALSVTPLAAVLLAEGIVSLATVSGSTGRSWWIIEIGLAALFMTLTLTKDRIDANATLLVLGIWLTGAAAALAVLSRL